MNLFIAATDGTEEHGGIGLFYPKIRQNCGKLKKISRGYIGGYAELGSSFECWFNIPSLMQTWIWYLIPALFGYFAAKRHQ